MLGVERNTQAETEDEKRITTLRCVKDRLTGMATGQTITLYGNKKTAKLEEQGGRAKPKPKEEESEEF